ncbi:MAG: formylglycine-generating enzyme family protein [Flavobacteriaceae bacterium]
MGKETVVLFFLSLLFFGCNEKTASTPVTVIEKEGMVWIPPGTFTMGSNAPLARPDEAPMHKVKLEGFWMDKTEVTNAQFTAFVEATGYVTTAEKAPNWDELKKSLPEGTPKPHDSLLRAASLVFKPTEGPVNLNNYGNWWHWTNKANWRQPQGEGSSTKGKENHPVVHVSWDDAISYGCWSGIRLPTEAEWEWAAKGGNDQNEYPWGSEQVLEGAAKANSWEGDFPYRNTLRDQFFYTAPVASFEPNAYGLYDMAGNVWEWCSDWYAYDYYKTLAGQEVVNPLGPQKSFDPYQPYTPQRVMRGGSFLCNDTYCSGYRVASRMKSSPDTGLHHTGFRLVKSPEK